VVSASLGLVCNSRRTHVGCDYALITANSGYPSFTLRHYRDGAHSDNPTYFAARERIYEGMRKAGVPEG
jgi:hypothetical protein